MKSKSTFGIEVEFYIVDKNGYPILNSNNLIKEKCLKYDTTLCLVQELSSFQIEINPGPWDLSEKGLKICLSELNRHVNILEESVTSQGWKLSKSLMPKKITQDIINNSEYFTKNKRFLASINYFKKRENIILKTSKQNLCFSGEKIIGCINEIHIHAQLSDDSDTLKLFNYLNYRGLDLIKKYNQSIIINGSTFEDDCDSLSLFKNSSL